MPRSSLVLQVFVASPADVAEERAILDSLVAELNRTWSSNLGLTFELLKWETHVRPGFDVDAQAVVNDQIPDDYDVFLGIFWSRLGTPTHRAASGSVEEFERAYARFKTNGSTPEIMIYFKDAPLAPSKIDAVQFGALQSFRSSLSNKGGLFSIFEDQSGFEASMRAHLSAIAQKFSVRATRSAVAADIPPCVTNLSEPSSEDDGLFEYLDVYAARTQDITAAMQLINDATVRVGEQLTQRTTERPAGGYQDTHSAKRHALRAAEDMVRYAETLGTQIPVLASARQDALGALSNAVVLMTDLTEDVSQLESLRTSLRETIESVSTARTGLIAMRNATTAIPRISKDLNRAKRAVATNLDSFLAEIDSTESTVVNIIDAMNRLLEANEQRTKRNEA